MLEFRIIKFLKEYAVIIKEPFTIKKLIKALFFITKSAFFISY